MPYKADEETSYNSRYDKVLIKQLYQIAITQHLNNSPNLTDTTANLTDTMKEKKKNKTTESNKTIAFFPLSLICAQCLIMNPILCIEFPCMINRSWLKLSNHTSAMCRLAGRVHDVLKNLVVIIDPSTALVALLHGISLL